MLSRNLSLAIFLIAILANAQSAHVPPSVRAAKYVLIENTTGDSSVLDSVVWKDSIEFDPSSNSRKDRTEHSWIEYLHRHPAVTLATNLLKLIN